MLFVAAHVTHAGVDRDPIGGNRATILYLGRVDHVDPANGDRRTNTNGTRLGGFSIRDRRVVLVGERTERYRAICVELAGDRCANIGFGHIEANGGGNRNRAIGGAGAGSVLCRTGAPLSDCRCLLAGSLLVNRATLIGGAGGARLSVPKSSN